jgi:hypothetical protein
MAQIADTPKRAATSSQKIANGALRYLVMLLMALVLFGIISLRNEYCGAMSGPAMYDRDIFYTGSDKKCKGYPFSYQSPAYSRL